MKRGTSTMREHSHIGIGSVCRRIACRRIQRVNTKRELIENNSGGTHYVNNSTQAFNNKSAPAVSYALKIGKYGEIALYIVKLLRQKKKPCLCL